MMARLVQVILLVFISLSLAACGGGGNGDKGGPSSAAVGSGGSGGTEDGSGGGSGGGGSGGGSPPSGTASTTVSWSIPSTRQSGASLAMSEIGGYKVYYGVNSSNLSSSIDVPDAYQTSQAISNLTSGTVYYFRVTAYDTNNTESQQSNLVNKTAS